MWRGREASPGFGPRGSPSRLVVSGVVSTRAAPVTVAGPRRTCTGFRNSRPQNVDCAVSLPLPALLVKRGRELALQLGAAARVVRAIGFAQQLGALHSCVELRDLTRQSLHWPLGWRPRTNRWRSVVVRHDRRLPPRLSPAQGAQ